MSTDTKAALTVEQAEEQRVDRIKAVDTLFQEVEAWSNQRGWQSHRRPLSMAENRLGTYQVWKLTVRMTEATLVFQPMARRVLGAEGIIDLIAPPSEDPTLMMARQLDGTWLVHPFGDSATGRPWTESEFVELPRVMLASSS